MVNSKAKKPAKKPVEGSGNPAAKKTSKKKSTVQEKKPFEKKKTTRGRKPRAKKAVIKSTAEKQVKGTDNKMAAQKTSLGGLVSREKDTIKIRETNKDELERVENVIEKLSKKATPAVQKKIPIVEIKNYLKRIFGGGA